MSRKRKHRNPKTLRMNGKVFRREIVKRQLAGEHVRSNKSS